MAFRTKQFIFFFFNVLRHPIIITSIIFFGIFLLPLTAPAHKKVVNIYAWAGEIPDAIVKQFENETGIKANFATYENNEIMFTKLRTAKHPVYDVVMPSSYFVDRMNRLDMLEPLDKSKLPNWKHLNPSLLHPTYDPSSAYSVPFIWGITGIFYNKNAHANHMPTTWSDLWDIQYANQLMLLDDTREVFSMALLSLGYSPNDKNPEHIKAAYLKLKSLMRNVKVFSSETIVSIMIDEDATLGMAWNGDAFKASLENPNVAFVFPKQGFVIWVDNFSIPKNATHKDAAYAFINFMLRPDVAKAIALYTRFPIANLSGQQLLPRNIRQNPVIYPPQSILNRGHFLTDVGEDALALYEHYWEELKMGG